MQKEPRIGCCGFKVPEKSCLLPSWTVESHLKYTVNPTRELQTIEHRAGHGQASNCTPTLTNRVQKFLKKQGRTFGGAPVTKS